LNRYDFEWSEAISNDTAQPVPLVRLGFGYSILFYLANEGF
jgi:hypothetical protein